MTTPTLSPEAPMGAAPDHSRPAGVSVLSIFSFLGAGMFVLFGLFWLLASAFLAAFLGAGEGAASLFAALGGVFAVFLFMLAAVSAAIGYGLWRGRKWAWMLHIVMSGIAVFFSLFGAVFMDPFSILWLLVNGGILWYLFRPEVRRFFGDAA